MIAPLAIKICGLSTAETLRIALDAGADMVGFVFFPPSPRHLALDDARRLAALVGGRAEKVALTVDADDATLEAICATLDPAILQLHGDESPQRVAQVRARFGRPVMKALGISAVADLRAVATYEDVCDRLLFDAKPPRAANRPGGNGQAFDWNILHGIAVRLPWMLSGGLTPGNVEEAIRITGAPAVDVSSGVESAPGVKDPALIEAFVAKARATGRLQTPLGSHAPTA